jgi:hypothetical protein
VKNRLLEIRLRLGYKKQIDFTIQIGEDQYTESKEKSKDYSKCLISGKVDDVSLSGKSLFPNFMQWIRYNFNTVTTILITSFISVIFTLITRKE